MWILDIAFWKNYWIYLMKIWLIHCTRWAWNWDQYSWSQPRNGHLLRKYVLKSALWHSYWEPLYYLLPTYLLIFLSKNEIFAFNQDYSIKNIDYLFRPSAPNSRELKDSRSLQWTELLLDEVEEEDPKTLKYCLWYFDCKCGCSPKSLLQ